MKKRQERLERIKAVEREHRVAKAALRLLQRAVQEDPGLLRGERLRPADAQNANEHLEARYLISLFAEFEAGVRDVWENALRQATVPRRCPNPAPRCRCR